MTGLALGDSNPEPSRYVVLDAMRGLAALAVMTYHTRTLSTMTGVLGGYLAVDLFFALSGFILFRIYAPRFRAGMTARAFIAARVLRLAPAYWLGILVSFLAPLVMMAESRDPSAFLYHVRTVLIEMWLIPSLPSSGDLFAAVGPAWTLMYETLASIAFVFLFPFITDRRLVIVMAGSLLCLAALVILMGDLERGWMLRPSHLFSGAMRTAYSFAAGILLARKLTGRPGDYPIIVASLLLVGLHFAFWSDHGKPGAGVAVASIAVLFPAMIALGSGLDLAGRARKIALWLGSISYPLYILHMPFFGVLSDLEERHPSLVAYETIAYLMTMVTTVLVASMVPIFWERPVRQLLASLLTSGPPFKADPTGRRA